jgi:hyperosmotically inducible protein
MKQKLVKALLFFTAIVLISSVIPACKSKTSDTEIKTSTETALRGNPDLSAVRVEINDGVATLSGEVKDEATRLSAESAVATVKGVKSVTNNISVAPAPQAPVEVTADDPLRTSVNDAIKDHPGVTASINDGVITLTGEIKKADLPTLMQKLNALKPKKIENQLTIK